MTIQHPATGAPAFGLERAEALSHSGAPLGTESGDAVSATPLLLEGLNLSADLNTTAAGTPKLSEYTKSKLDEEDILAMGAGTRADNDLLNPKASYSSSPNLWTEFITRGATKAMIARVRGPRSHA